MWQGSSERGVGLAAQGALLSDGALGVSPETDSDAAAGKEAPVSHWTGVGLEVELAMHLS